jgi:peptide subunit release factor 1 (eRF1)
MNIDQTTVRQLLEFTDPLGVLSITTGFTPAQAADTQPAARIELRNQLRDLQARLGDSDDGDRARALDQVVDSLGDDLDGLVGPRASGRGRALFVGLSDHRREQFSLQTPFENRVVLKDRPFLRPLVAAIDEGRPAGLIVADRQQVRTLEWTLGETRELATMDFELGDAQLADRGGGPVSANPARGQQSVSHREAFDDRINENRYRFLKQAAATIAGMVDDRRWDRVVVAGTTRVRDQLIELFDLPNGTDVLTAEASWENRSAAQLAAQAWPLLRSVHRQRERALVDRAVERTLAGGTGALGARKVCEAANMGRIEHLAFSHDAAIAGYISEQDTLHAEVSGQVAQAGLQMTPEPYLVERLVERVLTMGGRVTRVDDEDTALGMQAHQGVVALLRW